MRKDKIKIIKRINIGKEIEKIIAPTNVIRIESDIRVKLVNGVKDWIRERNKNSRIEKLFSEKNILNWKISTPKLTERTR